ncbi:cell division cycle protein 27 homolog [Rhagoletis pomonella]|uniref:cell division cycle protein 27 homolog n=1 Tax=Rhagoletis pomonella TaxID=28610 RepID=UPI0017823DD9|nr:cell division cycle protein 27 homolog [Rhagoletis pomonella]XP_036342068.1 cell division cycle protein 27 homolog [Rhagoletis pomonella]XP_036342069.1 cell division cycle protein 27 homolog [Rhagoletis pomonella]XP_036342070.1 cell division cycle protein 27 homolog [Rhagoletis pomonella]
MIIQEPVQAAIWHCLNFYDFKDAVFLSERLCCEVETDETIFLLATSYYRSNLIHQAYWLLKEKSRRSPYCRFLQAKCAYHLKKYVESECVLVNGGFSDIKNLDDIAKEFEGIACFVLQLIAKICVKTERSKIAAEALRRAIKLNPFMWHTFADLCHMGEYVDPASTFHITNTDVFNTCQGSAKSNTLVFYGNTGQNISLNDSCSQYLNSFGSNIPNSDVLVNSMNNSSNYILSTPVEQHLQSQPQPNIITLQSLITPNNNNNNLNNSMSMLRGANTIGLVSGNNLQNSGLMMLEDTPVSYTTGNNIEQTGLNTAQNFDTGAGTPFHRQFKYLSAISPATPSFGILPIHSPSGGESSFVGTGHTQANISVLNTPSPQTLMEANQEPKIMGKKMKSIISRRESGPAANKPAVFTQTGNVTPRMPINQGGVSSGSLIPNAAVRRSSRLFSNSAYSVKENNKSPNITSNKFALPRSPPRKTKTRMPKIGLNNELIEDKSININADKLNEKNARKEKEKVETITSATGHNRSIEDPKVLLNNSLNNAQTMAHHVLALKKQSADGLMALLRELGEGLKLLTLYQCKAAIKHLETKIPKHHLCSSWIQSLIGLAYYELREYESAVSVFKDIHETEPHRLQYMEIYSSSLWHLQKEVDLSALAQDLINQDKTSPVTWCVAGNCFSLHKEHETAIKFFKRAVQVDPDFVYSYTLLGHELVLTEELDKAADYFHAAVARDPRHYNAWFGMGTIYSKQEKYELAELYYIRALKINPQNSVILVHIGAMQYFMQKKEQALQTLNTAAMLDPKNPLARFHRGSIYFSLGKHQEALRELEELKEVVPKESVVFYLIGKIHKTLGNVDSALMHFSWATDLDPKGANNQLRDAFDSAVVPMFSPARNEQSVDADQEPISEHSDDSTQAQQDINYDSDAY